MMEQYLDKPYLDRLERTPAGSLASATSLFGMVVKNEHGDYWLLHDGALRELEECHEAAQMLVRQSNGDAIGLSPIHVRRSFLDQVKVFKKAIAEL